jgi:hypothetical protein
MYGEVLPYFAARSGSRVPNVCLQYRRPVCLFHVFLPRLEVVAFVDDLDIRVNIH